MAIKRPVLTLVLIIVGIAAFLAAYNAAVVLWP